ncbi:MAG TPA: hypothetical protein VIJ16_00455, partial [Gemmatimonadaceae bacterium]
MIVCLLALAALLQAPADSVAPSTARNPAYASDGRLAVSLTGDLWLRGTTDRWTRLTHGVAIDREPAWTPRGDSIVFSSNRAGHFSLWIVDANGGEPVALTNSAENDGQPAIAPDGAIYFIRGFASVGRLWVRESNGAERRVTAEEDAESWPAVSHDGQLAYVA